MFELTAAQVFWYSVAWSLGSVVVGLVVGIFGVALKMLIGGKLD